MKLRHWIVGVLAVACMGFPLTARAQLEAVEEVFEAVQRAVRPGRAIPPPATEAVPDDPVAPGETPAKEEKEESEAPRKPRAPLPPRYILLKLLDGSTIAGDLSVNEIKVKTE